MGTFQVVEEIKQKAPGWSRDGAISILQMMDRTQRYLYSEPCTRSVYIDPATGTHPTLTTQNNIYEYSIPDVSMVIDGLARPIRISKVVEVYTPATSRAEYTNLLLDRLALSDAANDVRENRVLLKHTSIAALEDNVVGTNKAKVIFPFNPGTYAGQIRYVGLIEPLRLTEDTIPLMVEEEYEPFIIEGALAWIEYYDYGRSDRLSNFMENWAHKFWNKQNKLDHVNNISNTPIRTF